jgi:DNA-directed RNA polymerase subunit alpha
MHHLRDIAGVTEEMLLDAGPEEPEEVVSSEVFDIPIEQLDLSVRVFNSLKRTGITSVGEVLEHMSRGDEAMMAIRNFGDKSLVELREKMIERGFVEADEERDSEETEPEAELVE